MCRQKFGAFSGNTKTRVDKFIRVHCKERIQIRWWFVGVRLNECRMQYQWSERRFAIQLSAKHSTVPNVSDRYGIKIRDSSVYPSALCNPGVSYRPCCLKQA